MMTLSLSNSYRSFHYDAIIILSGGKTGTSTLCNSFQTYFPQTPVFRFHHFPSAQETKTGSDDVAELWSVLQQLDKRFLVVNSYRLTFSKHVSSLFQNLHIHIPQPILQDCNQAVHEDVDVIMACLDNYMNDKNFFELYHPIVFHKSNESMKIKSVNGQSFKDIYLYENLHDDMVPVFNKVNKFSFHSFFDSTRAHHIDTLLLRFDQLSKWEKQIQSIFPSFRLVPDNVSTEKDYKDLYKRFTKRYRFPKSAAMELWRREQPMIEFYYDPDEVAQCLLADLTV